MSNDDASDGMVLSLPGNANLEAACAFAKTLAEVDTSEKLIMDASGVESMSAACVLTIISAINTRGADDPKIVVSQPAAPFMDAFSDLGLFSDLMKLEFAT